MERLDLDCFNIIFLSYTGTQENNIPPLDEVDEGEKCSTCHSLHFYSYVSTSTEVRTISDITLNSASLFAYTLVNFTIGYHHPTEK